MLLVDDVVVFLALKLGLLLVGPLQVVEIFEKQNPRRLFGVIEFRGAASLFPQNVIDVFESLWRKLMRLEGDILRGQWKGGLEGRKAWRKTLR